MLYRTHLRSLLFHFRMPCYKLLPKSFLWQWLKFSLQLDELFKYFFPQRNHLNFFLFIRRRNCSSPGWNVRPLFVYIRPEFCNFFADFLFSTISQSFFSQNACFWSNVKQSAKSFSRSTLSHASSLPISAHRIPF